MDRIEPTLSLFETMLSENLAKAKKGHIDDERHGSELGGDCGRGIEDDIEPEEDEDAENESDEDSDEEIDEESRKESEGDLKATYDYGPLTSRAWTWQGSALSSRTIYFCRSQI